MVTVLFLRLNVEVTAESSHFLHFSIKRILLTLHSADFFPSHYISLCNYCVMM